MATTPQIIHVTKLVGFKDLGSSIVYIYRCCGDPKTDSQIEILDPHRCTQAQIDAFCVSHATGVQNKHATKYAANAMLDAQMKAPAPSTLLAGNTHQPAIVSYEDLADEILAVNYLCCGVFTHREILQNIPRVDVTAELQKQQAAVARAHANQTAVSSISASLKF